MDTSYGETEKRLRISRNVEAKEMASDVISYQQIMKFEKGQTMISADKLIYLLEFLNVSMDEFEYARHLILGDSDIFFNQKIETAFRHKDQAKLRTLLKITKEQIKKTPNNRHFLIHMIEIKSALLKLNAHLKIPKNEIQKLYHYLSKIKEWAQSDVMLFLNCINLFDDIQLITLVHRMIYPDTHDILSTHTQTQINLALLKVISIFTKRNDFSHIRELFLYLDEHIHSDINTSEHALLAYHKALFNYCQEPNANHLEKLKQFISAFELIGCFDIANDLDREITYYHAYFSI